MKRTAVLNVVGLTRSLIGKHTPNLFSFLSGSVDVKAITPAVTCSSQSTYLTGKLPREHGIVSNGWYFRDLSQVLFWQQSNRLVQGEKIWHIGRKRNSSFTCANNFWWYNMASEVDWSVTPRPIYRANGLKVPDCYSVPAELRFAFNKKFGRFPLFNFWGPATSIISSEWIAKSAMAIEKKFEPSLNLIYLPHLDYVLQKVGPAGDISKDLIEIDTLCGRLLNFFHNRGIRTVILSEYGIVQVSKPAHPNRAFRSEGLLAIKTDLEREYLDPAESRVFSVSDHQIAHIYIKKSSDLSAVKKICESMPGVERVLDSDGKREFGLDHERSGELILLSKPDSWFTYYFWNDDSKAPDYARTVNIHAKPGYDPCELFIDPEIAFPKLKIAASIIRKNMGFRYLMELIPLDASLINGSHGRVADKTCDGPILMTSEPRLLEKDLIDATSVCDVLLDHVFVE